MFPACFPIPGDFHRERIRSVSSFYFEQYRFELGDVPYLLGPEYEILNFRFRSVAPYEFVYALTTRECPESAYARPNPENHTRSSECPRSGREHTSGEKPETDGDSHFRIALPVSDHSSEGAVLGFLGPGHLCLNEFSQGNRSGCSEWRRGVIWFV